MIKRYIPASAEHRHRLLPKTWLGMVGPGVVARGSVVETQPGSQRDRPEQPTRPDGEREKRAEGQR